MLTLTIYLFTYNFSTFFGMFLGTKVKPEPIHDTVFSVHEQDGGQPEVLTMQLSSTPKKIKTITLVIISIIVLWPLSACVCKFEEKRKLFLSFRSYTFGILRKYFLTLVAFVVSNFIFSLPYLLSSHHSIRLADTLTLSQIVRITTMCKGKHHHVQKS